MIRIYYHIYAVDGVESIMDEQLSLLERHFDFPYLLNIGISVSGDNKNISNVFKKLNEYTNNYTVRDVRVNASEFPTLDSILDDIDIIKNDDYIFYFHTKGASKLSDKTYKNIEDWRKLMMYFNVERIKDVFNVFTKTDYNTFGCLFHNDPIFGLKIYSGNFWWAKGSYIKTLNLDEVKRSRTNAEFRFIQMGNEWKPYTIYDSNVNHYLEPYSQHKYRL